MGEMDVGAMTVHISGVTILPMLDGVPFQLPNIESTTEMPEREESETIPYTLGTEISLTVKEIPEAMKRKLLRPRRVVSYKVLFKVNGREDSFFAVFNPYIHRRRVNERRAADLVLRSRRRRIRCVDRLKEVPTCR